MNSFHICLFLLCVTVSSKTFAALPDIDTALSTLAQEVGKRVQDEHKKKVAVADFNDFQGTTQGELGKYIAEQMTVNLVLEKRDFSVLDRANLRKILAEHKLTSKGLIDPENAKKIGMFAGVDVLVLGTIIPKSTNSVSLNAKIITTDTAEIIGAARTEFQNDEMVQQMVSRQAVSSSTEPEGSAPPQNGVSQQFGNLAVTVTRLRHTSRDRILADLSFQNKGDKNAIGVALFITSLREGNNVQSSLVYSDGTECLFDDCDGISYLNANPERFTEIGPGETIPVSLTYRPLREMAPRVTSITLKMSVVQNPTFSRKYYDNYRPVEGQLPRGATMKSLRFEIPLSNPDRDSSEKRKLE